MSERESFERAFKTLSHTFNESLCIIPNTDKYYSNIAQVAWEAWQASANREGYKLVPVEPTDVKLKEFQKIWLDSGCAHIMKKKIALELYKAMIGEETK